MLPFPSGGPSRVRRGSCGHGVARAFHRPGRRAAGHPAGARALGGRGRPPTCRGGGQCGPRAAAGAAVAQAPAPVPGHGRLDPARRGVHLRLPARLGRCGGDRGDRARQCDHRIPAGGAGARGPRGAAAALGAAGPGGARRRGGRDSCPGAGARRPHRTGGRRQRARGRAARRGPWLAGAGVVAYGRVGAGCEGAGGGARGRHAPRRSAVARAFGNGGRGRTWRSGRRRHRDGHRAGEDCESSRARRCGDHAAAATACGTRPAPHRRLSRRGRRHLRAGDPAGPSVGGGAPAGGEFGRGRGAGGTAGRRHARAVDRAAADGGPQRSGPSVVSLRSAPTRPARSPATR